MGERNLEEMATKLSKRYAQHVDGGREAQALRQGEGGAVRESEGHHLTITSRIPHVFRSRKTVGHLDEAQHMATRIIYGVSVSF